MKLNTGFPQSLQGRLVALVLALVLCVWVAIAATIWFDGRHELDELLDAHLAQAASLLVAQQARAPHEGDDDDEAVDTPALHRYATRVAFQVFHDGQLVLRSTNAPRTPMVALDEDFRSGFKTVTLDGLSWRVFAAHGAERDVQVYVGEQQQSRASILWAVLRGALWPMLLALPLLALAVWWAVWRETGPLRELGHRLAERSPQDLQALSLARTPAEVKPMLAALNQLFLRMAERLTAERRFTADAAHELRTPLAAIRAQAQVALGAPDAAARRHALEATLQGCDRATRLVEQLLTLARLEATNALPTAPVALRSLLRRVLAELAPAALQKQQALALEDAEESASAESACVVAGDDTLLAVLLRNLVDNALRYSPAGARIQVTLQWRGDHAWLQVADSGPGLAEADLARLGERFFRVLGSTQAGQSGSGLGWSIVRRIASVHQARVQLGRSAALGGLEVSVEFPAPPPPGFPVSPAR